MEEEKYQKELFEFEKPKRRFPRLANIFPKPDFEGKILLQFTLERAVFVSIGVIMLMVVIYALGVEGGKSMASKPQPAKTEQPASAVKATKNINVLAPIRKPALNLIQPAASASTERGIFPTPLPSPALQDAGKPYTIVVATFRSKDGALQEMNKLKRQGFETYLLQSDPYFLVSIGAYPDKDSAESKRSLTRIRQLYKDAYFKLR